ncbi:hypothetical protein BC835DRAFT_1311793 [Cytidiella melzeri]|nr:hypothetical protein BC835DRAFT_1311793 [Cytidiella melzeri]
MRLSIARVHLQINPHPYPQNRAVNSKAASQSFLLAIVTFALSVSVEPFEHPAQARSQGDPATSYGIRLLDADGEGVGQELPDRRGAELLLSVEPVAGLGAGEAAAAISVRVLILLWRHFSHSRLEKAFELFDEVRTESKG